MKSRQGFVSNSSSTAFILDARNKTVSRWLMANYNCVPSPKGAGRMTCIAMGKEAVDYAKSLYDPVWGNELGDWILEWAEKIGVENIVFARESDEGMGGYLDEFPTVAALAEMEYH